MKKLAISSAIACLIALLPQSEAKPPAHERPLPLVTPDAGYQVGVASWYGEECQGNLTASGEVYDMHLLTAAHRGLPFNAQVKVTNLRNN
jgi:rare lipoprotein A